MGCSKNVSYCYFYWQTLFLLFPAIRFSPPFLFVAALMHTPSSAPAGSLHPFIAPSLLWWGRPRWLSGKESACSAGDAGGMGSIPGLGRSPEEGMATHSSILAWEIPWIEEPGWLQVLGVAKSQTRLSTRLHSSGGAHSGEGLELWPCQVQGWKLKSGPFPPDTSYGRVMPLLFLTSSDLELSPC